MMDFIPSFQTASKEVVEERQLICNECEHNKVGVCGVCFCIIQLKTKRADQHCPKGKWDSVLANTKE